MESERITSITISVEELKTSIGGIKNKPTLDSQGMSNKIIKHGGDDFVQNLCNIFNVVNNQDNCPKIWEEIIIKSIFKGKGTQKKETEQ